MAYETFFLFRHTRIEKFLLRLKDSYNNDVASFTSEYFEACGSVNNKVFIWK